MKTVAETVTVEEINATTTALREFRKQLPFVVPLTAAERRDHRSARIGPTKLRVLENRLVAAREHRDLLPPSFDLRKFEQDTAETVALGECIEVLDEMWEAINDTLLAVGNRAVVAGATAYAHIQVGWKTAKHLQRTVEKLSLRRPASTTAEPEVGPLPVEGAQASPTLDLNPTSKAA